MPALASHVGDLKNCAKEFLLDIEVIRKYPATLEIGIDHLQRAANARGRIKRRCKVDVLRDIHRLRERRIGAGRGHDVRHRLVVVEPGAAADYRLAFSEGVPRETDSGTEIGELLVIGLVNSTRPDADELPVGEIEDAQAVINLAGYAVVLPAQSQVQGQFCRELYVVLNECAERVYAECRRYGERGLYRLRRRGREESSQRRKQNEAASAAIEIVVAEAAKFAAELYGVPTADPGQRVRILKCRIATSLGEPVDAAEPRIAASGCADLDFGHHAGWSSHPVVRGISREGLLKIDSD